MERLQSLAEYLGTAPPEEGIAPRLEDITDGETFAKAVINSREFRGYIINGLVLGSIPAAVLVRVMDLAGWQAPPKRLEVTGRDGKPIEHVTEVRRVVVRIPEVAQGESRSSTVH